MATPAIVVAENGVPLRVCPTGTVRMMATCTGACAVTADYSDHDSDLWDPEGTSVTTMDLKDDPHLNCCMYLTPRGTW